MTSQIAFWIVAALVALFARSAIRAETGLQPRDTLIGLLLPIILVGVCLWTSDSFGDLRLRFSGIEVKNTLAGEPLRMGGDPQVDDLFDPFLPASLVELRRDNDGKLSTHVRVFAGGMHRAEEQTRHADDALGVAEFRYGKGRCDKGECILAGSVPTGISNQRWWPRIPHVG